MGAPKEWVGAMLRRVSGRTAVYVRETSFGYIIRSERSSAPSGPRARLSRYAMGGFVLVAALVWLLPLAAASPVAAALLSTLVLGAGLVAMTVIHGEGSGIELHVDVNRRELRSAVVTARGDSWIRSSARFGEVAELFLRRVEPGAMARSLCLRLSGEDEVMPIALGAERTLLAVHDRLLRDLRISQDEARAHALGTGGAASLRTPRRRVFPQLGPDERPADTLGRDSLVPAAKTAR
jgi:hypothetical protein